MRRVINISILLSLFVLSGCYSCKSWNNLWGTGPVEPGCEHKFFLDKDCRPMAKAVPKPQPVKPKPSPAARPMPAPESPCGPYNVSRSYPCKDCGIIRLDKTMPAEVQLNAPFEYTIKVINVTDMMVADIELKENLPENFKFTKANPSPEKEANMLIWKMNSLGPGESRLITVYGSAATTDCLKHCATVTYVVPACANVNVVEPELKLVKTAPDEVLLCDPIPIKLIVTNSGSGDAKNVKITDTLPDGLKTSDGRTRLTFDAGNLTAGQSKQFSASLMAEKTGKYVNNATATSEGGLKAQSQTTTIVRQPVLQISKSGPEKRYLGRSITYEITVSNKGDASATELVVEDSVPMGARFVSATAGGRLMQSKVVWNLGTLSAGSSRTVSLTLMPERAGTVTNTAMAKATCAEGVRDSASTEVAGIPAVLLEVIDVDDPVEVGSQTTYVIVATNQGSSPGTNISIVCTLEDNQQYVSSSGATAGTLKDDTVTFAPLRSLAPQAKATWRVVVKAMKAGDVRFKVIMNTDQIDRPVQETEATHLYE